MRAGTARRLCALHLAALGLVPGARAADLFLPPGPAPAPIYGGAPRYFPRSDGNERVVRRPPPAPVALGCAPRRVPVPTNAPDDPSYVGSAYGLSRPSYYGLTPPPGIDDPFGRSLLPYCP